MQEGYKWIFLNEVQICNSKTIFISYIMIFVMSLRAQKRPYSTYYKKGVSTATVIRNWFKQCVHLNCVTSVNKSYTAEWNYILYIHKIKQNFKNKYLIPGKSLQSVLAKKKTQRTILISGLTYTLEEVHGISIYTLTIATPIQTAGIDSILTAGALVSSRTSTGIPTD